MNAADLNHLAGTVVKVFAAYGGENPYSANAPFFGASESKSQASLIAEKKGEWGSDGFLRERYALKLGDGSLILLDDPVSFPPDVDLVQARKDKKEAAEHKARKLLTIEERLLLGLKLGDE